MPYDAKSTPRPPDCDTIASGARHLALVEPRRVERLVPAPHAHAVRSEQHGAGRRTRAATRGSTARPSSPVSREADRDADERAHAARQTVLDHVLEAPAPAPPAPPARTAPAARAATAPWRVPAPPVARSLTRWTGRGRRRAARRARSRTPTSPGRRTPRRPRPSAGRAAAAAPAASRLEQRPADDQPLDVVGALVQLLELGVAQPPLDRVLGEYE